MSYSAIRRTSFIQDEGGSPLYGDKDTEYLQEALPVMESDIISLILSGPLNPGLITGSDDPEYCYVAMPMQIL